MKGEVRIAFFCANLAGGLGGVVQALIVGLSRPDRQITLITGNAEDALLRRLPDAVRVIKLGTSSPWRLFVGLTRILRSAHFDIIVSSATVPNAITIVANLLNGARSIVVTRDDFHITAQIARRGRIEYAVYRAIVRFLYPLASRSIAVSEGVAEDLKAIGGRSAVPVRTIYNPAYSADLPGRVDDDELSRIDSLRGTPDTALLVAVCRLTAQKDVGTLIKAVAGLVRTRPVRLLIVGDGPQRRTLEELVSSLGVEQNVCFVGYKENPLPYMAAADVFVLSSAWEGFGNVLVEAMAVGTPVVATDCPSGPAEILGHGRWGKLAPVGNPEALRIAIEQALVSPPARGDLVARAQEFSAEVAIEAYEEELSGALAS